MTQQAMTDRMLKLLPHWAEHTEEHIAELQRWRRDAEHELAAPVIAHLSQAEGKMRAARVALDAAHQALKDALGNEAGGDAPR